MASRQVYRANYPTLNPQIYYKQSTYIHLLDYVIQDLKNHFSEDTMILFNFFILFPGNTTFKDMYLYNDAIKNLAAKYQSFFKSTRG